MSKSIVRKQIGSEQRRGATASSGRGLLLGFDRGDAGTAENVPDATELYILKWLHLCSGNLPPLKNNTISLLT